MFMLLRRPSRLFYDHVEVAGTGRLRAQVRVTVPDPLRIGPDASRWLMMALHQGHQQLLTELSEHHKSVRQFFAPPPFALPMGRPKGGEMIVEVRANTAATRLQMHTHLRNTFAPIASVLIDAITDPIVRAHMLAELAAVDCRNCGVRIEVPDGPAYERIVSEIISDPPTSEDVLSDLNPEVPVGLPQDVARARIAAHLTVA
jgi:hypothetical protein